METTKFTLRVPSIGYKKTIELKVKCSCKKSKPAKSFKELVDLIKQTEERLTLKGFDIDERIHMIRGVYYGTPWSIDYNVEKSEMRSLAFNRVYTHSGEPKDIRKELKCMEGCKSDLFSSLYNSFEVFENKYKAVDLGHLIIGLDARRSWIAKNIDIPTQGGTGLEICTWVGDLGGGVGKLAIDRVKNPKKRSKTIFPVHGHSYGSMVNLEGDIAAYIVGLNINEPSEISDLSETFETIHEALEDYFQNKWDKRTLYFLKMLGGNFDKKNTLINKSEIVKKVSERLEQFASWYLGLRMKDKNTGGLEKLNGAMRHFEPISQEVASIFVDGLLHVITNPQDMITARTNPKPKEKTKTVFDKAKERLEKLEDKINELNSFD